MVWCVVFGVRVSSDVVSGGPKQRTRVCTRSRSVLVLRELRKFARARACDFNQNKFVRLYLFNVCESYLCVRLSTILLAILWATVQRVFCEFV